MEIEKNKEFDGLLNDLYYTKKNLVARDKLHKLAKEENPKITRKYVEYWLRQQKTYQLTKQKRARSTVQSLIPTDVNKIHGMDLIIFENYADDNKGYKYILTIIDLFSKKAWAIPLKNKTADTLVKKYKKLLDGKHYTQPSSILSDNGTEFKNEKMAKLENDYSIRHLFAIAGRPESNGVVERFNYTLKKMIYRNFHVQKNKNWVDSLKQLVDNYNGQYHKSIKMPPDEAIKPENKDKVYALLTKNRVRRNINEQVLEKGDNVRLASIPKNKLEKLKYNWTNEVFIIESVIKPKDKMKPIKYKVKDKDDEPIKGFFTINELQLIPKKK
jgi:transposase InsO family protein